MANDETSVPPAKGATLSGNGEQTDDVISLAEGRPDMNGPIMGSVPRAGPALRADDRAKAILAEAQAALLRGDTQKAGDLFAEAARLAAAATESKE